MSARAADLFTSARFATSRAAFARFFAANGQPVDATARTAVRAAFDAQDLLGDSELATLCRQAVAGARGHKVTSVRVTIWDHLRRTSGGAEYAYSWPDFAAQHDYWARMVVAKGEGQIYAPITTESGERLAVRTRCVHALVLDCDGTGTWDALRLVLSDLGIAAIFHASGGFTPELPKWRAILPLSAPVDVSAAEGAANWRMSYATARVALGSLARLRGAGFDPATDLVNNAWFPGYRRDTSAPRRAVHFWDGATLDLTALTGALPAPVVPPADVHRRPRASWAPSLLELSFEEAGLLGPELPRGLSAVTCPWNDCHTAPLAPGTEPTSATVIFPPTSKANIGAFHCAHGSCGTKSLDEVLAALPLDAVHRARLRHIRGAGSPSAFQDSSDLPRLPLRLARLSTKLP